MVAEGVDHFLTGDDSELAGDVGAVAFDQVADRFVAGFAQGVAGAAREGEILDGGVEVDGWPHGGSREVFALQSASHVIETLAGLVRIGFDSAGLRAADVDAVGLMSELSSPVKSAGACVPDKGSTGRLRRRRGADFNKLNAGSEGRPIGFATRVHTKIGFQVGIGSGYSRSKLVAPVESPALFIARGAPFPQPSSG